jgi:hypothetical protein
MQGMKKTEVNSCEGSAAPICCPTLHTPKSSPPLILTSPANGMDCHIYFELHPASWNLIWPALKCWRKRAHQPYRAARGARKTCQVTQGKMRRSGGHGWKYRLCDPRRSPDVEIEGATWGFSRLRRFEQLTTAKAYSKPPITQCRQYRLWCSCVACALRRGGIDEVEGSIVGRLARMWRSVHCTQLINDGMLSLEVRLVPGFRLVAIVPI